MVPVSEIVFHKFNLTNGSILGFEEFFLRENLEIEKKHQYRSESLIKLQVFQTCFRHVF